jgi:hypothetical protein
MSERQPLPVVSCDGCGACCMHMHLPPQSVWADRVGELSPWAEALPAEVLQELLAHYRQAEADGWPEERPCVWLDLETKRCRHYEHRPAVCRDFEVGKAPCLQHRKAHGLPTPPEEDWPPARLEDVFSILREEPEPTVGHIRVRLAAIAAMAQTMVDALGGAALDLAEGARAELLAELESLGGRLALVLDRLAGALDPVQNH